MHQRPVILRPQLSDVRENELSSYQMVTGSSLHPMSTLVQSQDQQKQQQQPQAPTIDFKLNVKIEINSGKCVLHANKSNGSNGLSANQSSYYAPGSSSRPGQQGQTSPYTSNYFTYMNDFNMRGAPGSSSLPHAMVVEQEMRNTNFIFPAIGVKAFYESTHKRSDIPSRLAKKVKLLFFHIL